MFWWNKPPFFSVLLRFSGDLRLFNGLNAIFLTGSQFISLFLTTFWCNTWPPFRDFPNFTEVSWINLLKGFFFTKFTFPITFSLFSMICFIVWAVSSPVSSIFKFFDICSQSIGSHPKVLTFKRKYQFLYGWFCFHSSMNFFSYFLDWTVH